MTGRRHLARRGSGRRAAGWFALIFGGSVAGHVACGGSTVSERANDAGADSDNRISDASMYNESCSHGSDCVEEADGLTLSGGHDAEMLLDATADSNAGVLCAYHTGPLAPGQDAGGPVMQCRSSFVCINVDKGWACCSVEGGGGVSVCLPFLTDGN
jgi:hypothetical protein